MSLAWPAVVQLLVFIYSDFNLTTQGFAYLEFIKYQLGSIKTCKGSRDAIYAYLLIVLYTDMCRLSSYIKYFVYLSEARVRVLESVLYSILVHR